MEDTVVIADLGKAVVHHRGPSTLTRAIHNQHGLAWTDGQAVYLAPLSLLTDPPERLTSVKLGEFECVQSLQWSCDVSPAVCYLCVVHKNTISLWRVNWSSKCGDLDFKQVRKINASPIPQGCLWHPHTDVLCVLSTQQCSFYSRHTQGRVSFALPAIDSGQIRGGCWMPDGQTLVIGIKCILLIYHWNDISKLSDYTLRAWKIPNIQGTISNMVSTINNRLLVAMEMPLEKLCTSNHDLFRVPDKSTVSNRSTDDLDIIKPRTQLPTLESLMNLRTNEQVASDSSFVLQVSLPTLSLLTVQNLPGIIKPDLLYFHKESSTLVVGSSSSPVLLTYFIDNCRLIHLKDVKLSSDERPKGISSLPLANKISPTFLVMAATKKTDSSIFPTSSSQSECKLKLKGFNLNVEELLKKSTDSQRSIGLADSLDDLSGVTSQRSQGQGGSKDDLSVSSCKTRMNLQARSEDDDLLTENLISNTSPSHIRKGQIIKDLHDDIYNPLKQIGVNLSNDRKTQETGVIRNMVQDHYEINYEGKNDFYKLTPGVSRNTAMEDSGIMLNSVETTDSSNASENEETDRELTQLRLPCHSSNPNISRVIIGQSDESLNGHEIEVHNVRFNESEPRFENSVIHEMRQTRHHQVNPFSVTNNQQQFIDSLHNLKGELYTSAESFSLPENDIEQRLKCVNIETGKSESSDNSHSISCHSEAHLLKLESRCDSGVSSTQGADSLVEQPPGETDNMMEQPVLNKSSADFDYEEALQMDMLEKDLHVQAEQIRSLQNKVADIGKAIEKSCCVSGAHYQSPDSPDLQLIHLIHRTRSTHKTFLLDRGRLQLEPVKESFDLKTVEFILDGVECVVGANVDGYIPLRFVAGSTVHIQGKSGHADGAAT